MTPIFDDHAAENEGEILRVEEAASAPAVDTVRIVQSAIQCSETAAATGQRCRKLALEGHTYCLAHAPRELQQLAGFGGAQPGSGRPARRKPMDLIREAIAEHAVLILKPYMDTLGLVAVYDEALDKITLREAPSTTVIVQTRSGDLEEMEVAAGAKLFSTTNGRVNISHIDDLGARVKVAGELFDRVFGKAGSTIAVTGAGGGALEVRIGEALTPEATRLAAQLAQQLAIGDGDD